MSLHTSPLAQPGVGDAGGLNVYVTNTARILATVGYTVNIFTADPAWDRTPGGHARVSKGITVYHIATTATGKDDLPEHLDVIVDALRHHPAYGGEFVWAHYWISALAALEVAATSAASGTASTPPLAVSFHTIGAVKNRDTASNLEPPTRLEAEHRIAGEASLLVANTPDEAHAMRTLLAATAPIAVAPPGVNHAVFHPTPNPVAPTAPTPAPAEGGGDGEGGDDLGDGFSLLSVGRLQYVKGTDVVLRALARLRAHGWPVRLTLLGSGSGEFRQLASLLGVADAVTFGKPVPPVELARWYRQVDVVVVPSRSESFGFVAAEAAATGVCVVASQVGGLPSVVIDGVTGALFSPGDDAELAAVLARLLADPGKRRRLGVAGLAHARTFTWDTCVGTVVGKLKGGHT